MAEDQGGQGNRDGDRDDDAHEPESSDPGRAQPDRRDKDDLRRRIE